MLKACELNLAQNGYMGKYISQTFMLYKTPYTQEKTWVAPIDYFIWVNVNNTPPYIPMEQTHRLGPNTYVYPHVPKEK